MSSMTRARPLPVQVALHSFALASVLLAIVVLLPEQVSAHGISGLTSLPVPAWLFAWVACIVLVVSFFALSHLWTTPRLQVERARPLTSLPAGLAVLTGAAGVALFALIVYAGYEGTRYYTNNIDPTFIFVIFWVAVPVSTLFLGDWFRAFNPWLASARAVRWVAARVGIRGRRTRPYPQRLGRWPVVAGLVAFGWLELVYHDHDNPTTLASLSLAYFVLMLAGMGVFGIETWSERGDAFGGYFSLIGRLSPLHAREGKLWLRRPLSGAPSLPQLPGTVAIVLVIIGITTFDGASNGVVWNTVQPHVQSIFAGLGLGETPSDELADSLGLLLALAFVAGVYRVGVIGMRSVSRRFDSGQLARSFAHTLVPIGLAYVVAHYFSLLIWQGQAIAYLASDPLGNGADYFGTAHWHVNYHVLSYNAIWYAQVLALVSGHVGALALAHDRALALYRSPEEAVRSQYWMLVVMVGFTSLGLWLLSAVNT